MSRLALPLYVYGCPSNLLHAKPQPLLCLGLSLWMACQACPLSAAPCLVLGHKEGCIASRCTCLQRLCLLMRRIGLR